MSDDVIIKELKTHADDYGFFRELIRISDIFFSEGFGQCSLPLMFDNTTKAWHLCRIQTDWWYAVSGVLGVGPWDMRTDSPTYKTVMDFFMGVRQMAQVLTIPPGVDLGCETIQEPVNLFYVTSLVKHADDEILLTYNDPEIDYDWARGPIMK